MNLKRIYAIFVARNIEFYRDKAAFAWSFVFPVIAVIVFSFSFNKGDQHLFIVGVKATNFPQAKIELQSVLPQTDFVLVDDVEEAKRKVERHLLDLYLDFDRKIYLFNTLSQKATVLEKLLDNTKNEMAFEKESLSGQEIRYVDWVIPGILAMNIMFSALWGIGYVIVRYRKNSVLKRISATPISPLEFLIAQLLSRSWLILLTNCIIFIGLNFFIHFRMHGSYLLLFFIFALGSMNLISLGLIIAARVRSEELAGGLLNLLSWPMMFISGVWFSLENAAPWVKKLALIFPLTHVTDAARKVMIEGLGINAILPEITYLSVSTLVFLLIGSLLFKWE